MESPESNEIWTITIRCAKLPNPVSVPILPSSPLSELVEFINERTAGTSSAIIEVEFTKLFYRGKLLDIHQSPSSVPGLRSGDTILLVFSTRETIESMKDAIRSQPRIRSIEEEAAQEERRRANLFSEAEEQDDVFKFCAFRTVDRFTTPHPFEAMRLLKRLAVDPAIKRIMKSYQWTVGSLEEMDPKTDMIALLRKQFEDGACVLGYNENAGHRIFLRLRTDDEVAFRSYNSLVNTLLHELTHNVHGPHDEQFWALFAKLKKEYLQFHQVERGGDRRMVDLTEGQVEREVRSQGAGNAALTPEERKAALTSLENRQNKAPPPPLPLNRLGAVNSRARKMEREKFAAAAERRIQAKPKECDCGSSHPAHPPEIQPPKPTVGVVEPSALGYSPEFTSKPEREIRQGVISLCKSHSGESARLVHVILSNALTGNEKYRQVKTTGEKFSRLIKPNIAAMQVLTGVGFAFQGSEWLVLSRFDPGLLLLAKQLMEEFKLLE